MNKLKMESVDITEQNIEKIAELFPQVVTEVADPSGAKNDDGTPRLRKAIDFEKLKLVLSAGSGDYVVADDERERYEFTWVGKRQSMIDAATPIRKTLRPCPEESKNWDSTENLYIEGDNLEVLKLLQESYLGKVKMIYIDPPYNTGKDFVYRDNFSKSREEYEGELDMFDEEGNKLFQNTETNGRFHSDWCSMIYPRLQLARNLLTDDGVIFMSIDDNEVENLKKICDEVFGANNFVADLIWKKKAGGANDSTDIAVEHEYIICYKKKINGIYKIPLSADRIKEYKYKDSKFHTHGGYTIKNLNDKSLQDSKGLHFDIVCPDNTILSGSEHQWKCNETTYNERLNDDRIVFKQKSDGLWTCNYKIYLNEEKGVLKYDGEGRVIPKGKNLSSIIDNVLNKDGADEIKKLFKSYPFSYPKPSELIKLLAQCCTQIDSIVLDFFSGSSTTAQAIMQLNAEDGGSRKFIMVQLPEKTDEKSEAYKAGYPNICEIGKERIRRAGVQILTTHNDMDNLDVGFRVFRVDSTNMKDVYYSATDYSKIDLFDLISNIKDDRSTLDLLYGCLLDWGMPLTLQHQTRMIGNSIVHFVNDTDLIACLDDDIKEETIRCIAELKPLRVLFKDLSFANSANKINIYEIFKSISDNTTIKVI